MRLLKNLDRRLTNVEQIVPTLATKEDLKALATKEELKQGLSEVRAHAVMLFEQTQEQLGIIATHLADISQRLPPRQ
ncbi:MAG: hypothetical protein ACRD3G_02820 [Vicinamibacterales bacterium]